MQSGRAGTKKQAGTWEKRHPYQANHSLWKLFKTRCEILGMKPINGEKLMNHSVGISDSYFRATEIELLEDYLKVVGLLLVNDEKLTLQKQVENLREKTKSISYKRKL
jgi:hypothetical protein